MKTDSDLSTCSYAMSEPRLGSPSAMKQWARPPALMLLYTEPSLTLVPREKAIATLGQPTAVKTRQNATDSHVQLNQEAF